jgi:hypothetical protein
MTVVIERLDRIEQAVAFRPAWIKGYAALGRYMGHSDTQGRIAKAWAAAEGLRPKLINGVPHFAMADVDRAMRNGRPIETRERGAA